MANLDIKYAHFEKISLKIEKITVSQLVEFLITCRDKYMKAIIEPGNFIYNCFLLGYTNILCN